MKKAVFVTVLNSGLPAPSVTRLLDDQFTDTVAAGSVDDTAATPGPGQRGVGADTGNLLSIASGRLKWTGKTTSWDDPRFHVKDGAGSAKAYTRAAGLALAFDQISTGTEFIFGWMTGTGTGTARFEVSLYFRTSVILFWKGAAVNNVGTYAFNETRKYVFVLRSSGCYVFQYSADLSTIDLLWVEPSLNTSSLYIGGGAGAANIFEVDNLYVGQLGAPFDTDYGYANVSLTGARSAGDAFTHAADSIIEYTLTTRASSGQTELWFRSDAVGTNGLRVTVDSSGNIDLDRVESGTPTQIATGTGVTSGMRIAIQANGRSIRVYADGTLKIEQAAVSQFETSTGGELEVLGTGGAVSNIYAYPVNVSGKAKQWLDALAL